MSGSAILDPDILVDSLVPDVIDGLREDLHPAFGVRPYRVFTVLRTWSGGSNGEGTPSDVETEIRPQPKVDPWNGLDYQLEPCGLDLEGTIKLSEVSLACTQRDLDGVGDGDSLGRDQQFLIRVDEAHGRAGASYFFTHAKTPYKDTEKTMGWIMWLKSVSG